MILFSDRGTPKGYFREHGYSGHTFKFVNNQGKFTYVQIHVRADNGFHTFDNNEAGQLAGSNPDYGIQDLSEAIEKGQYPSWTVYVQTMTPEQAEKFRYNILDLTKVWPHGEFPLQPIGKIVLNENPKNYFDEIEQAAFSPSHLVAGIEPSADPVLQSRLFSYPDTHRHRLGVNYHQIPVNAPVCPVANFQRGGFMSVQSQGNRPNYQSSIQPLSYKKPSYQTVEHEQFIGGALTQLSEITELDFEQPRVMWQKVFNDEAREHYVQNIAGHFGNVKSAEIKARQLAVFAAVDQSLSDRIAKAIGHPTVKPLKVKPAEEAGKFKAGLELKNQTA